MLLPAGYFRNPQGTFSDATGGGPYSIGDDNIPRLIGSLPRPGAGSTGWSYFPAAAGIVNSTVAVQIAAAATGKIPYVTGLQLSADALGVATAAQIQTAGGTVLWRAKISTVGLPLTEIKFDEFSPLVGTVGEALQLALTTLSVTGGVYVNAQGYSK